VREGIAVDKLHCPVKNSDETSDETPDNSLENVTVGGRGPLPDRAKLPQAVDECDDQTPQTDTSKGIREGTLQTSTRHPLRIVLGVEVPASVDPRDGSVDGVLEPLGNPVRGEGDEDQQTDDLALAATTSPFSAGRVVGTWFVLDIDGHQRNRVPGRKNGRQEASNGAHHVHMAMLFRHINGSLEHQHAKWDTWDPGDECEDQEG